MNEQRLFAGMIACSAASFLFIAASLGWQQLVAYRQSDGLAFTRAMRDGRFDQALVGHRCSASIYNWCFEHLPGEPRDNDDEHVPPVSLRGYCDNASGALCYTLFPVECATEKRDGSLDFEACDRVFPHGPKHTLELLLGRDLK